LATEVADVRSLNGLLFLGRLPDIVYGAKGEDEMSRNCRHVMVTVQAFGTSTAPYAQA